MKLESLVDVTATVAVSELQTNLNPSIPYYFGSGALFLLPAKLTEVPCDRFFLCTSPLLWEMYGEDLCLRINSKAPCEPIFIPDYEVLKSIATLDQLCEELVRKGVTKDSVLLALGGGVIGNLVGLAAALIFRGIRFIEVPTTTMGQTDSVLSHKQAVNGVRGKNHFGLYYAPIFIWVDPLLARTEPMRTLRSGLVESVKNGFVSDPGFLDFMERAVAGGLSLSDETLTEIIYRSAVSKMEILRNDPTERKYGVVLEYGHTVGHAIEKLSYGGLTHGEAVAIGMTAAARISQEIALLTETECARHKHILGRLMGIDLHIPANLTPNRIMETIAADNKRTGRGVRWVVLERIGKVYNPGGDYLVDIKEQLVLDVLAEMRAEPRNLQ